MGILAWLSAGPLGPGRMAHLGPSAWRVGIAVMLEVGLPAAATTWMLRWRQLRSVAAVEEPADAETGGAQPV